MIGAIRQRLSLQTAKAVANIGWVFVDRIFRMLSGLIVGIWAARYLGPEQFGLLNYAIVFPAVLLSVSSLGLTNLILTELVRESEYKETDILGTGFILKLVAGLVCFLGIVAASYWLHYDQDLIRSMIFFSSFILIFQSADVLDLYFQSKVKSKQSVKAKTVALFVSTSIRIFFLVQHYGLLAFSFLVIVEASLTALVMISLYNQEPGVHILKWKFNRQLAQYLLRLSWPVMLSEFFIFVYMRVNQFMINGLASSEELGKFSAALKLSEVWYFIAIAITSSFYPSIVRLKERDQEAFKKGYQQLLGFLAFISISISLITTLFADFAVSILYGDAYNGVAQILIIHIWSGVFVFMGVGIGNWFILHGMQRVVLYKTLIGAILNIGFNLVLIPLHGAVGASIATLCAYFVSSYGANYLFRQARPAFQLQTLAFGDALRLIPLKQFWQRFN